MLYCKHKNHHICLIVIACFWLFSVLSTVRRRETWLRRSLRISDSKSLGNSLGTWKPPHLTTKNLLESKPWNPRFSVRGLAVSSMIWGGAGVSCWQLTDGVRTNGVITEVPQSPMKSIPGGRTYGMWGTFVKQNYPDPVWKPVSIWWEPNVPKKDAHQWVGPTDLIPITIQHLHSKHVYIYTLYTKHIQIQLNPSTCKEILLKQKEILWSRGNSFETLQTYKRMFKRGEVLLTEILSPRITRQGAVYLSSSMRVSNRIILLQNLAEAGKQVGAPTSSAAGSNNNTNSTNNNNNRNKHTTTTTSNNNNNNNHSNNDKTTGAPTSSAAGPCGLWPFGQTGSSQRPCGLLGTSMDF